MRSKVMNRIPGKRAQERGPEKDLQETIEVSEKAGETGPKILKPENREMMDDKNRKSAARKAFEAEVRGKLKYSRKR
jgi:hypothetical protein